LLHVPITPPFIKGLGGFLTSIAHTIENRSSYLSPQAFKRRKIIQRGNNNMKAIVTVIGKDKVGIIAQVSAVLAENMVNILDISQTILQDYFTMIMLVDLSSMKISFSELHGKLEEKGKTIGLQIKIQREEVFKAMHQI
jgi:ACT domain-containing protein